MPKMYDSMEAISLCDPRLDMYSTTSTLPATSTNQLLAEFVARALLWLLAVLVTVAVVVNWSSQLHQTVCEPTQVLGQATVCLLDGPTRATLDVAGLRDAHTIVVAAQDAAHSGQKAVGGLHDSLEQAGSGSSSMVRQSSDGLDAVGSALDKPIVP